jgi:hypothetical protein
MRTSTSHRQGSTKTAPVQTQSESIGSTDDAAWNGTDPEASVISILKACYAKLAEIATNTATP